MRARARAMVLLLYFTNVNVSLLNESVDSLCSTNGCNFYYLCK